MAHAEDLEMVTLRFLCHSLIQGSVMNVIVLRCLFIIFSMLTLLLRYNISKGY